MNALFNQEAKRFRGDLAGTQMLTTSKHGIDGELQRAAVARLKQTELARAREVWRRRFGVRVTGEAERARQMRFLLQRGFSGATVRLVVGGDDD